MASRASRSGVRRPWSRRVEPMSIREITIEVAQLAPRLVDHMVQVRTASGSLRAARVPRFTRVQADRFRVGVPHGSRILVNDDRSEWAVAGQCGESGSCGCARCQRSAAVGPGAVRCWAAGRHLQYFPRGTCGFFARAGAAGDSDHLAADLQRISALPEADLPINKALVAISRPNLINTAGTGPTSTCGR